jgi:hypothetical protein
LPVVLLLCSQPNDTYVSTWVVGEFLRDLDQEHIDFLIRGFFRTSSTLSLCSRPNNFLSLHHNRQYLTAVRVVLNVMLNWSIEPLVKYALTLSCELNQGLNPSESVRAPFPFFFELRIAKV